MNTNSTDLIRIADEKLERVWDSGQEKSFKLVGIHIDETLKWQHHIKKFANKVAGATYGLNKASKELSNDNKKLLYSLLESVIRQAKNMYYNDTITAAGSDSRKLWGVINEVIDRKQWGAAAYQLGNTSSRTITEVKQR